MTATSSTSNSIDRKLHRIVLDSDAEEFKSYAALARSIAHSKPPEFSYHRFGKLEYAGTGAIVAYISFAQDLDLLDKDLKINRPKKEVRTLENFQQWLGDRTMQYLEARTASLKQIEQAMVDLAQNSPCLLTTPENIRSKLENPPAERNFKLALRILALLRDKIIRVVSHRVVLMDGVIQSTKKW